jgi:hypothetical protein
MPESPPAPGPSAQPSPLALNQGDVVSALSALLLLVLMFAVAWYGVDGIPGRAASRTGISSAQSAWDGLSLVRWLMLLTVAVALGNVAIRVREPSRVVVAGARLALLMLAVLTAASLTVRVLIALPSPDRVVDQKLGAIIGVISALAVAFGAYESVREQRSRMLALVRASTARNRVASSRLAR